MEVKRVENKGWNEVIQHYQKAKEYFWGSEDSKNWHRDDENGYYHLWTAYHMAQECKEKNHLWYARILYMMLREHQPKFSDYYANHDKLHKFAIPMMEEFLLAAKVGTPPTEKEFEIGKSYYESLLYDEKCHSDECNGSDEAFQLIENGELLKNFYYTDSVPVFFQHNQTSALLKLKNDQMVATLEFTGLWEINVNCDPSCNWIEEFFCYPCRNWKGELNRIIFEIDHYIITCEHIKVLSVEKTEEAHQENRV